MGSAARGTAATTRVAPAAERAATESAAPRCVAAGPTAARAMSRVAQARRLAGR